MALKEETGISMHRTDTGEQRWPPWKDKPTCPAPRPRRGGCFPGHGLGLRDGSMAVQTPHGLQGRTAPVFKLKGFWLVACIQIRAIHPFSWKLLLGWPKVFLKLTRRLLKWHPPRPSGLPTKRRRVEGFSWRCINLSRTEEDQVPRFRRRLSTV